LTAAAGIIITPLSKPSTLALFFIGLATLLSNPSHPPRRLVKINGRHSAPFTINCGVPQGCPFCPLAFLIVAEALTRLINSSPDYEGVTIGHTTHRITQFADDTQLILRDFKSLAHVWPLVRLLELATGMLANIAKFVAILRGSLRGCQPPPNLASPAHLIRWLPRGEYTTILGVPFWSTGENDAFWHALYTKIKKRIASWQHHSHLTIQGRTHLANLVVYGIPWYWTQTLLPPEWFDEALI
jgi:hypothetical protein